VLHASRGRSQGKPVVSLDAFYKWPCDDLCGVLLPELPRARSRPPEAGDFLSKLAKDDRTLRANSHREVIAEKRSRNGIRKKSSTGFPAISLIIVTIDVPRCRGAISYRCSVFSRHRQPRDPRSEVARFDSPWREAKEIDGGRGGGKKPPRGGCFISLMLPLSKTSQSLPGRRGGAGGPARCILICTLTDSFPILIYKQITPLFKFPRGNTCRRGRSTPPELPRRFRGAHLSARPPPSGLRRPS